MRVNSERAWRVLNLVSQVRECIYRLECTAVRGEGDPYFRGNVILDLLENEIEEMDGQMTFLASLLAGKDEQIDTLRQEKQSGIVAYLETIDKGQ